MMEDNMYEGMKGASFFYDEGIIGLQEGKINMLDLLNEINKERSYQNPIDHMSGEAAEQFHSAIQESIKKVKEDGY